MRNRSLKDPTTGEDVPAPIDQKRRYLDNPENPRRRADDALIPAPVVPQEYPKAKYHATEPSKIVANKEEEDALVGEWFDVPQAQAKIYPSWRFHKTKPPVLVNSAAEDAALGEGWYPSVDQAAAGTPK